MGLFDKVKSVGSSVGSAASSAAVSVGSSVATSAKEQSELAGLKAEVNVIEKELDSSYAMIGKRYVEYVLKNNDMPAIDVSDVLKLIDPKIARKNELQAQIIELEKRIKEQNVLREKQKAEEEFQQEKDKLEKAVAMGIMDQADCDAKIALARKKLDNFETIRKLDQQVQMGIITEEEKNAKLFEILN